MARASGLVTYVCREKEYLLLPAESDEVEAYSQQEPDDEKYDEWFLQYVKDKGIQPRYDASRSKYWSGVSYGGGYSGGKGDDAVRMAMIQRAATSLIRVVSPDVKPSDVAFAPVGTSTVDIAGEGHQITLPTSVIKGKDIYEDIDAVAGYGIHEAYHLNDSVPLIKNDTVVAKMLNNEGWEAQLIKFIEDMRVNALGNADNPGFSHYIDEVYDRIYETQGNEYQLPDEWPSKPINNLNGTEMGAANVFGQQLSALAAPMFYGKHVGTGSDKPYYDKIQKAQQILSDYVAKGRSATPSDLRQAKLDIAKLLDPPAYSNTPVPMPVPSSVDGAIAQDEQGIEDEQAQKITAAIAAGMSEEKNKDNEFLKSAGIGDSSTTIVKPIIKWDGFQKIGKMPNEVLKADAELRLTRTLARNEEPYTRSGDLNEDELYRLFNGDDRVFIDVTEEVEEEAAIYFVIDVSGSMGGSGIQQASQMAWLLVHSMNKRKNVKVKVFAFTSGFALGVLSKGSIVDQYGYGNNSWQTGIQTKGTVLYRIFEEGDSLDRLDWLPNLPSGGTPEADAVAWCGKELLEEEEPRKYLIMLTDGSPGGAGPGGVRKVVNQLMKKGLFVAHIGLYGADPIEQKKMYDYYVTFKNIGQTIKEFSKILDKVR